DVAYAGGGLEGCWRHRIGQRAFVSGCGRAELGRLSGTARGFDRSEGHARPLAPASLLARGQLRLVCPASAFAELGAATPISRERFQIDGVGLVHDPAVVAPVGAVGGLLEFE